MRKSQLLVAAALMIGAQAAQALPISGTVNVATWTVNAGAAGVADPGIAQDFQYMNSIYSQIGITFNDQVNNVLNNTAAPGGSWTVNNVQGTGNLMDKNNVGGGVGNPINLYYISDYNSFGEAWAARRIGDTQDSQRITDQGAVVTQTNSVAGTPVGNAGARRVDTVAHELGHILLNNWAFRAAEGGGGHSSNYAQATSPYVPNNTGAQNLMETGADRTIPGALNQVAPVGNLDQINLNIGQNNRPGSGFLATPNAVMPEISAMYNNNQTIQNVNRDLITATVGSNTTAQFGWGLTQTVSGVTVNEAAQTNSFTPANGNGIDDVLLEFRANGVFVQGGGLNLAVGGIASLPGSYVYTGVVPNSLQVMTVDNILNNPGVFTTLPADAYTSTINFNNATNTLTNLGISFDNLPAGQQDILVEFQLQDVPEPMSLGLMLLGGIGLMARRNRGMRGCEIPA